MMTALAVVGLVTLAGALLATAMPVPFTGGTWRYGTRPRWESAWPADVYFEADRYIGVVYPYPVGLVRRAWYYRWGTAAKLALRLRLADWPANGRDAFVSSEGAMYRDLRPTWPWQRRTSSSGVFYACWRTSAEVMALADHQYREAFGRGLAHGKTIGFEEAKDRAVSEVTTRLLHAVRGAGRDG